MPAEPNPDDFKHKPPPPDEEMPGPPLFDPDEISGDEEALPEGEAPKVADVPAAEIPQDEQPPEGEIEETEPQVPAPHPAHSTSENLDSNTLTTVQPGAEQVPEVPDEPFDAGATIAQGPQAEPELEAVVPLALEVGDVQSADFPGEQPDVQFDEFPGETLGAAVGEDTSEKLDVLIEEMKNMNRRLERILTEGIKAEVMI